MKKNLYITKRRYSEHILPVTWPVLIEVPYGNDTFMSWFQVLQNKADKVLLDLAPRSTLTKTLI